MPAAAVSIVSYTILSNDLYGALRFHEFMVTMVIGYSLLMVSSIEFEARPHTFRTAPDRAKMAYILVSVLVIIIWPARAIFPVTLGYIGHGLLREGYFIVRASRPAGPGRSRAKKGGHQPGP